jgi:polar amino acid transport system permease protein
MAVTSPLRTDVAAEPVFVARRHPGRWVGVGVIVVIAAAVGYSLATNPRFQWGVVFGYLFDPQIIAGLRTTCALTAIAMVMGIVLGVVLATMRVSGSRILRGASALYLWFFRGTPVLVQLIFWYNLGYLYPDLRIGLPFGSPLWTGQTNDVITPLTAAILGLGLNEGAYLAEIVRAGLISVSDGQREAAASIGLTRLQAFRRIILPQAMRVIIPPTGNETIGMLKTTSMVSVIALADLLYSAQQIYARTFETIPLLICVSLWYLLLTSVLSVGQGWIERHYARGVRGSRGARGVRDGSAKGRRWTPFGVRTATGRGAGVQP